MFNTETLVITTLSTKLPKGADAIGVGVSGANIYLFGGRASGNTYLNTINMFNTENQTITTLTTTLPTSANSIGVGVVGAKMYLFGGYNYNSKYLQTTNVFTISFPLDVNTLLLQLSLINNMFNLIGNIELGVTSVYLGNSDGIAEEIEAYLYKNEAWTQI